MRKDSASQSGVFNPRVLAAFALCSVGALLSMRSVAANPASPGPYPRPGHTQRASVPYHGGQSNLFADDPAMSSDGRVAAWDSYATDFVSDDINGVEDVFARDLASELRDAGLAIGCVRGGGSGAEEI